MKIPRKAVGGLPSDIGFTPLIARFKRANRHVVSAPLFSRYGKFSFVRLLSEYEKVAFAASILLANRSDSHILPEPQAGSHRRGPDKVRSFRLSLGLLRADRD